jgi:hypothetical protein
MKNDPTKRILPTDRLSINYINSCCNIIILWNTDLNNWDTTNEMWGKNYYTIFPTVIYIGT